MNCAAWVKAAITLLQVCPQCLGTCSVMLLPRRFVRMAYLAIVASHSVNGVAAIHSKIIKNTIFKDFADFWPQRFQNKTNGVTPRRWLAFCNPPLRQLISDTLGTDDWINDLDLLQVSKPNLLKYLSNCVPAEAS